MAVRGSAANSHSPSPRETPKKRPIEAAFTMARVLLQACVARTANHTRGVGSNMRKTTWIRNTMRAMTLATGVVIAGAALAGTFVATVWFVHDQATSESMSDAR